MKFSITVNGREHTLEITRRNGLSCLLDGVRFEAEAFEVRPGVYSLLLGGKSFLAQVAARATVGSGPPGSGAGDYSVQVDGIHYAVSVRDPRRRPHSGSGLALAGKQSSPSNATDTASLVMAYLPSEGFKSALPSVIRATPQNVEP